MPQGDIGSRAGHHEIPSRSQQLTAPKNESCNPPFRRESESKKAPAKTGNGSASNDGGYEMSAAWTAEKMPSLRELFVARSSKVKCSLRCVALLPI
jgi:hypothetical protein